GALRRGGFAQAVTVLVGGTALGHAITAAGMPILTRLYSPAEFGLLAAFSAILMTVSVAVCLRYEVAIAMPEDDQEAENLFVLAALVAVGTSAVSAVLIWFGSDLVSRLSGQPLVGPFLWLLPLCLCYAGVFAALQYWLIRRRQFTSLASARVIQSGSATGVQIGLGAAGFGPIGLILGPLLNSATGCLALLSRVRRDGPSLTASVSWQGIRDAAWRHRNYPMYSATEALANSASIQLPVLLIAVLGSTVEAGHLMLAMFVVQAPMALLGTAVSQVYLSRAPEELRSGNLARFTIGVLAALLRTGGGPLLALGIVAPFVFAPVFGDEWRRAGVVVAWLTPWFVLHFLTAPVSIALHVCGRQRAALVLQIGGLMIRVGAVITASTWIGNLRTEAYALSGLAFYALYLVVVLRVVGCTLSDLRQLVEPALRPCALWIMPALIAVGTGIGLGWI
ncbi:MAG: oligosaccharide flippase family protein, partial [Pseudomonadota bacterium]